MSICYQLPIKLISALSTAVMNHQTQLYDQFPVSEKEHQFPAFELT